MQKFTFYFRSAYTLFYLEMGRLIHLHLTKYLFSEYYVNHKIYIYDVFYK